jgi:SAM-dependent methyltransferase
MCSHVANPPNAQQGLIPRIMEWLARQRRAVVLRHARGRLLDVGCGDNRLVREYGDGIGVDVYNWGDVDILIEDAGKLPFDDNSFDTVSFVACLNHIPNREEALREAYRVLRPGGLVLITMIPPLISVVWHRIVYKYDTDQSERGMKEGEVYGLTASRIVQLLRTCGFEYKRRVRFVFGLNNLYIALKPTRPST